MDAGKMRERLDILTLQKTALGYAWCADRRTWAKVELTGKNCYFSKVGLGARAAEITLRRQPLDLREAICWRGKHLFPTEITTPERGWMTVQAAVMDVGEWSALGDRDTPDVLFPAAITEKYLGYAQERPMAESTVTYVLVTPKVITLRPSDLVSNLDTAPGTYVVTCCHTIDPWKNEYEITRREEP